MQKTEDSASSSHPNPVHSGNRGEGPSTSQVSGSQGANQPSNVSSAPAWFAKDLDPTCKYSNLTDHDVDKMLNTANVTPTIKLNPNGSNLGPWANATKVCMVMKGCWAAVCRDYPDTNANVVLA